MMAGEGATSPSTPILESVTPFEVYLRWEEPYDNGGNDILSYTLEIFNIDDISTNSFLIIDS